MENLWLLIKYTFLGLFQGLTEPIPISSSGHLVLLRNIFNLEIHGLSFEVLVNFGSLLAVLFIYRKDILELVLQSLAYLFKGKKEGKKEFQFVMYLVIGTIPAGVIGILFEDVISDTFGDPKMVGITLLVTGVALYAIRNLRGRKGDKQLTIKDALIVGFAQAIALIPGISRSGATIVAAMGLGMKQETALKFSFLLYIPVSLGTAILSAEDIVKDPDIALLWMPYILAFAGSIIATYYSLRWFMNIMAKGNLKYFAYYCFIVGILAIIIL